MKPNADHLRREIAAIREREPFQTRRYPTALQRAVVAFAHEQRRVGRRPRRVAHDLGLTEQTLAHWLRTSPPSIRPVTIATVPPPSTPKPLAPLARPVVVLASGHRVEGLDLDQLVTLVRALA